MELDAARENAPVLLEALRERAPQRAAYIEDVFSEVLRGLRRGEMKDPEMVDWLFEALDHHAQEAQHDEARNKDRMS
jgi:hypothetical protein